MKEWWKDFFVPVIGEIMFQPRAGQSQLEVDEILRNTKIQKQSKILDLACGVGRHSVLFAKLGFDVVGLDFSKNYLVEARKTAVKTKSDVKFVGSSKILVG